MPYLEELYVNRLLFKCTFTRDRTACKTLDAYIAVARIVARLEDELKDLKLAFPVDPIPAPDAKPSTSVLLSDGDPDGSPARVLPTVALTSDKARLKAGVQTAKHIQQVLGAVVADLDKDIAEIQSKL